MSRLLLLSVLMAFTACGDGAGKEVANGQEDTVAQSPATSNARELIPAHDQQAALDPLGDDSVFTDGSIPASWENAGFSDPVGFKQFLIRLRGWVTNGQRDSVAQVVDYPLRNPKIAHQQQFLQQYDSLFNEKVRTALLQQNLRQIFRRDQGAMIGDGAVWFRQSGNRYLIVGINNK
ncbi:hypothetical protein [Paraflavitalea pollutisoli]|uniref:hypothetical protein n=1 Tax=Paraflavitalea pollutisoli TaxID=3034143 RepID=UPI0023ED7A95|nr:hypothetical protein [Paraflavitalea sp. H1-2-19X]